MQVFDHKSSDEKPDAAFLVNTPAEARRIANELNALRPALALLREHMPDDAARIVAHFKLEDC